MPRPRTPRAAASAAALLILAVATITACAPAEPVVEATATAAPTTVAPSTPAAAPTTETGAPASEATCTSIIPEQTVLDYEAVGWTSREEPFMIGGTEVPDGLWCSWADFTVAGDHLQIFGWAPIDPDDAKAAQDELLAAGWVRETGDEGVFITENPDTAIAPDEEGYGMTYLFGNGWVIVSDTKQSLILIDRPVA